MIFFSTTRLSGRQKYCGSPHKVKCIYLLKDWSGAISVPNSQRRLARTASYLQKTLLHLFRIFRTEFEARKYSAYIPICICKYMYVCVCLSVCSRQWSCWRGTLSNAAAPWCHGIWMRYKLFMTLTLNYDCNGNASLHFSFFCAFFLLASTFFPSSICSCLYVFSCYLCNLIF